MPEIVTGVEVRTAIRARHTIKPHIQIATVPFAVKFDTVAREWRMKWSADEDKASLAAAQVVLTSKLEAIKAIEGVKNVQRVVCGGCLDVRSPGDDGDTQKPRPHAFWKRVRDHTHTLTRVWSLFFLRARSSRSSSRSRPRRSARGRRLRSRPRRSFLRSALRSLASRRSKRKRTRSCRCKHRMEGAANQATHVSWKVDNEGGGLKACMSHVESEFAFATAWAGSSRSSRYSP